MSSITAQYIKTQLKIIFKDGMLGNGGDNFRIARHFYNLGYNNGQKKTIFSSSLFSLMTARLKRERALGRIAMADAINIMVQNTPENKLRSKLIKVLCLKGIRE